MLIWQSNLLAEASGLNQSGYTTYARLYYLQRCFTIVINTEQSPLLLYSKTRMTWQFAIIIQIIASSVMTMYTRQLSLSVKKVFFGVAVLSYIAVASAGWIYSSIASGAHITLPASGVWPYLLIEGICIPAAWLIQYKLISYIGASNAVIVTTLNTLVTALAGILFLHDTLTLTFVIGGALVLGGVLIALRLQPDTIHKTRAPLVLKVGLTVVGALLFGAGMYAEKVAVNDMGAWDYMGFGWSMQAVGALTLFMLFGKAELKHMKRIAIRKGFILGILTSIAGALYIYAVSIGSLSHTIIAVSGKTVLVMALAALFLHERNAWPQRLLAFVLTAVGLMLILS